jgi:hypothetical protein
MTTPPTPTPDELAEVRRYVALLSTLGFRLRPDERWLPDELAMVAEALADLLRVARWSPTACANALGGPITLLRDHSGPITTDAAGTRYPILGLYDANRRLLTINDWSFDARVGGATNGRRIFLHELAHCLGSPRRLPALTGDVPPPRPARLGVCAG